MIDILLNIAYLVISIHTIVALQLKSFYIQQRLHPTFVTPHILSMSVLEGVKVNLSPTPHIRVIVPGQSSSYFSTKLGHFAVPWSEVFTKLKVKLIYEKLNSKYTPQDHDITLEVTTLEELQSSVSVASSSMHMNLTFAPIILMVALHDIDAITYQRIEKLCRNSQVVTTYNCSTPLAQLASYGAYDPFATAFKQQLLDLRDRIFKQSLRVIHKKAYSMRCGGARAWRTWSSCSSCCWTASPTIASPPCSPSPPLHLLDSSRLA
jgi:hypothetical protein